MAETSPAGAGFCVSVAVSLRAGEATEWSLQLPAGATLADALAASVHQGHLSSAAIAGADCGIWGKRVLSAQPLREGDRVELYRPLTVDPKTARRERFAQQGARTAGLFAHERNNKKLR